MRTAGLTFDMTLSFHEIGLRWPDAVVYWDRDVAPTLDWEPAFVDVDGVLWAVEGGMKCGGVFGRTARSGCRCRVWEPTLKQWWTHAKWDRLVAFLKRHELHVQMIPLSEPTLRDDPDTIEWRMRGWLQPIGHWPSRWPID